MRSRCLRSSVEVTITALALGTLALGCGSITPLPIGGDGGHNGAGGSGTGGDQTGGNGGAGTGGKGTGGAGVGGTGFGSCQVVSIDGDARSGAYPAGAEAA